MFNCYSKINVSVVLLGVFLGGTGCCASRQVAAVPSLARRMQQTIINPKSTELEIKAAWAVIQHTDAVEDPWQWVALIDNVKAAPLPREMAMALFASRFMGRQEDLVGFVKKYHIEAWFTPKTVWDITSSDYEPLQDFLAVQEHEDNYRVYSINPVDLDPRPVVTDGTVIRDGFDIEICITPYDRNPEEFGDLAEFVHEGRSRPKLHVVAVYTPQLIAGRWI